MLPKDLWELLLSHNVPILALGDPAQLPPIYENTNNHVLDNPHIFLNEIMRQAEGNEIIKLSMNIRNGSYIAKTSQCKEAMVVSPQDVVSGMYSWADQIICATNKKRMEINNYMRQTLGFGAEPANGDKVIACINKWEILDTKQEMALVNGTIGYLDNVRFDTFQYPILDKPKVPIIIADLKTEEEEFKDIIMDRTAIETGKKFLTPQQEYSIYKSRNPLCPPLPVEFNYGYAITCWKAQGSEWDRVLFFEENFPFDRETHQKYLYTGVTRSSEKIVFVKNS